MKLQKKHLWAISLMVTTIFTLETQASEGWFVAAATGSNRVFDKETAVAALANNCAILREYQELSKASSLQEPQDTVPLEELVDLRTDPTTAADDGFEFLANYEKNVYLINAGLDPLGTSGGANPAPTANQARAAEILTLRLIQDPDLKNDIGIFDMDQATKLRLIQNVKHLVKGPRRANPDDIDSKDIISSFFLRSLGHDDVYITAHLDTTKLSYEEIQNRDDLTDEQKAEYVLHRNDAVPIAALTPEFLEESARQRQQKFIGGISLNTVNEGMRLRPILDRDASEAEIVEGLRKPHANKDNVIEGARLTTDLGGHAPTDVQIDEGVRLKTHPNADDVMKQGATIEEIDASLNMQKIVHGAPRVSATPTPKQARVGAILRTKQDLLGANAFTNLDPAHVNALVKIDEIDDQKEVAKAIQNGFDGAPRGTVPQAILMVDADVDANGDIEVLLFNELTTIPNPVKGLLYDPESGFGNPVPNGVVPTFFKMKVAQLPGAGDGTRHICADIAVDPHNPGFVVLTNTLKISN